MTDRPQAQPDTVPPPPGEDDVYSAETRVDPLPKELLELMRSSRAEAAKGKAAPVATAASTAKTPIVPPPPPVPRPSRPGVVPPPAPSSAGGGLLQSKPKSDDAAPLSPSEDGFADFGYTEESTEPTLDKPIRYINKAREMAGLEALKEPAPPPSAPQPPAEQAALPEPLPEDDLKPTPEELGTRRGMPFPLLLVLVVLTAALAAWLVSSLMNSPARDSGPSGALRAPSLPEEPGNSCGLPHESESNIRRLLGRTAREAHRCAGSTEPANFAFRFTRQAR